MSRFLVIALLGCVFVASASDDGQSKTAGESTFTAFLPHWEAAQARFINGDPTLWKENASHGDDASIFGAFGGHEKGWA